MNRCQKQIFPFFFMQFLVVYRLHFLFVIYIWTTSITPSLSLIDFSFVLVCFQLKNLVTLIYGRRRLVLIIFKVICLFFNEFYHPKFWNFFPVFYSVMLNTLLYGYNVVFSRYACHRNESLIETMQWKARNSRFGPNTSRMCDELDGLFIVVFFSVHRL